MAAEQNIPVVDLRDWNAGGEARKRFARTVGESLADIGFFAVANHGISEDLTQAAYANAKAFFSMPLERKRAYINAASGQRGYTTFGTEHAKDSNAPDLKEFWQIGRTDVPDTHLVHQEYGPNIWPDADVPNFRKVMTALYEGLDGLGGLLLQAAAEYIGEATNLFSDMAKESDTIVRVLYYPPVGNSAPPGAVRSAAHEDINLITLLSGATSEGLELLRRDGSWMPVHTGFDTIVVDSGDMLQNLTNGFYKSTTHRVVNPKDPTAERFSMPCFIHPRREISLAPLASCLERTGGAAKYPNISSGDYLQQRLREIGLAK